MQERQQCQAALGKSYVTPVQHEVFSRHLTDKDVRSVLRTVVHQCFASPCRFQCQEQSARQADLLLQVSTRLQTRRSVCGHVLEAPTGTGKTIAFLLPALQRLLLLEEGVHVAWRGKTYALGPATTEDARRAGKSVPEACGMLADTFCASASIGMLQRAF